MSIDILKGLFEQHFRAAPDRVQPLQGQLGGSGRIIVRLAGEQDNAPSTIDSASNNHQRFVRAALQGKLTFPGYDQNPARGWLHK